MLTVDSFIFIDSSGNYFDTKEQILVREKLTFTDSFATVSTVKNDQVTSVAGLFSGPRIVKDNYVNNSSVYLVSSSPVDPSGKARPILASTNDYAVSSSIDSYKNGVEITQQRHWVAGVSKITAGTPGHLYDSNYFGETKTSIADVISTSFSIEDDLTGEPRAFLTSPHLNYVAKRDTSGAVRRQLQEMAAAYTEIELFDPVQFVSGKVPKYPIVTMDSNEAQNYILNGVIEPFPIRSVVSNFSINHPFEPHSFKGQFGNGNTDTRSSSDQVVSIDYFVPRHQDENPFLDAVDAVSLTTGGGSGAASVTVGVNIGYVADGSNHLKPFVDLELARGAPSPATYTNDLFETLYSMSRGGDTYVQYNQKSATCGYIYDNTPEGTDSIAYGGLLH